MLTGLLVLLTLGFWLWSIFDVITTPAGQVRTFGKLVWLAIVVLLNPIGSVCWFFFGRAKTGAKSSTLRSPGVSRGSSGAGMWSQLPSAPSQARKPGRPVGPDDDPDFLRRL